MNNFQGPRGIKFFLDTANLDEIRQGVEWGLIDGVTTNPTLVAKEGANFHKRIVEICDLVSKTVPYASVSAEVTALDAPGMLEQGKTLSKLHPNVTVKVPLIPEGLRACLQLRENGIQVNVTLCFSPAQAILAAKAGATYVSPFVGRLDDIGSDGMHLIREIAEVYQARPVDTQILSASLRHPMHVVESAKAGAHVATMPFSVMKALFQHPLTDSGLKRFLEDWDKVKDKVQ